MDTLNFPNWIIEPAKYRICNISTLNTYHNRDILRKCIDFNENYSLKVTGKVW